MCWALLSDSQHDLRSTDDKGEKLKRIVARFHSDFGVDDILDIDL